MNKALLSRIEYLETVQTNEAVLAVLSLFRIVAERERREPMPTWIEKIQPKEHD